MRKEVVIGCPTCGAEMHARKDGAVLTGMLCSNCQMLIAFKKVLPIESNFPCNICCSACRCIDFYSFRSDGEIVCLCGNEFFC